MTVVYWWPRRLHAYGIVAHYFCQYHSTLLLCSFPRQGRIDLLWESCSTHAALRKQYWLKLFLHHSKPVENLIIKVRRIKKDWMKPPLTVSPSLCFTFFCCETSPLCLPQVQHWGTNPHICVCSDGLKQCLNTMYFCEMNVDLCRALVPRCFAAKIRSLFIRLPKCHS